MVVYNEYKNCISEMPNLYTCIFYCILLYLFFFTRTKLHSEITVPEINVIMNECMKRKRGKLSRVITHEFYG